MTSEHPSRAGHYLHKQRLVLVCLIRFDLHNSFGVWLEGNISPESLFKSRGITAKLVCILLGHLANSERPAVMGASKGNIAQLRLKVVFFVLKVNFILLGPALTNTIGYA